MTRNAIVAENISKQYQIGESRFRNDTMRDEIVGVFRSLRRKGGSGQANTFWALRNVSFEVRHGEVVGIIGSNGAGKSTLLKILSRITSPTTGFAEIYGRIGSLLEVGTGFHPELTGRENIYLNGAILGMRKAEIEKKFDEIVAFSEIGKFLDTPVKRYSSGMQIRLAFAVAAHLDPEILLIDEVLAVGDVNFQKKCLGKMENVARQGRTVLFVSHNLAAVENLCEKGIVLRRGEQVFQGSAKDAVRFYLNKVATTNGTSGSHVIDLIDSPGRPSQYQPLLKSLELLTEDGAPLSGSIQMGSPLRIRIRFNGNGKSNLEAAIGFDTLFSQRVFTAHTAFQPGFSTATIKGDGTFVCDIPSVPFVPGEYKVLVALGIDRNPIDVVEDAARLDVIESDFYGTGRVPWNGLIIHDHHWRNES